MIQRAFSMLVFTLVCVVCLQTATGASKVRLLSQKGDRIALRRGVLVIERSRGIGEVTIERGREPLRVVFKDFERLEYLEIEEPGKHYRGDSGILVRRDDGLVLDLPRQRARRAIIKLSWIDFYR